MAKGVKHKNKRVLTPEGQEKLRLAGYAEWMKGVLPKHGEKFDYSRAKDQFKTQKKPDVEIRCIAHDEWFSAKPFQHLRSKNGGCKKCDTADAVAMFRETQGRKFRAWFDENRGDRLEMVSAFDGMSSPMVFRCKIHGTEWPTLPTNMVHIDAYGCLQCAKEAQGKQSRLTHDGVVEELAPTMPDHVKILGVRFDEDLKKSMIDIECEWHGKRAVTKGYLNKSAHKCPDCGDSMIGYVGNRLQKLVEANENGREAYIAVMEVEAFGIRALKVGVTHRTLEQRYSYSLKKVIFSVRTNERAAYTLENRIHRKFRDEHDKRILKAGMRAGERWSGDTECYWQRNEEAIITYIKEFLAHLDEVNYEEEFKLYEVYDPLPRDTSREKDLSNQPCPIVGVDPKTLEIVHEFNSIGEAAAAGFKSVRSAVSIPGRRGLSRGLRWFKKAEFNPDNVPPLPEKNYRSRAVRCVETGEIYLRITDAVAAVTAKGKKIVASGIVSACNGSKRTAGGYRWEYAD